MRRKRYKEEKTTMTKKKTEENKKTELQEQEQSQEEQTIQGQEEKAEQKEEEEKEETANGQTQEEKEEEKDPLEAANEQIAALTDKYLRSVAELDNYRKRTMKEKAELLLNGSERAIMAILPVVDDMERALKGDGDDAETLKDGLKLIYNKMVKTLEGLGVSVIDTEDADFNTDLHEAIAMVPGMGNEKKGKVIDCVQKGYKLNDKVIRHAKVAVGQ